MHKHINLLTYQSRTIHPKSNLTNVGQESLSLTLDDSRRSVWNPNMEQQYHVPVQNEFKTARSGSKNNARYAWKRNPKVA